MTASSRPSANRPGAGLVVMGCAGEDAESLRDALDALRQDGLEVELCEGLDHDPKRLSELIERHDGRGLYVLCRSPRLGRQRVEELREILLARHVPFARTLTVAVGGRGALADRIRSGLRRASARTSGPTPQASSAGTPQLVSTGRSRPVKTTHATEDEEPTLVGKRDTGELEGLVPEPSIPRPAPLPSPPATPAPPPRAEISVIEAIDADLLTEDTSASQSGAAIVSADLDLSDLDNTGAMRAPLPDTTAVGPAPAMITGNTVIGPAPTGDTLVGERLPPALREAAGRWPLSTEPSRPPAPSPGPSSEPFHGLEPATTPLPRLRPQSSLPAPPPPPPPTSNPAQNPVPPSPWASASMAGAEAPATSHSGMSSPDMGSRVPAARSKVLPWALGGVALLLLALVIGLALSNGQDPPELAASNDSTADDAKVDPSPSDPTPADDAKADSTPAAPPVYPVVTALRSRQVRALDILLIATAQSQPSDYAAAAAYCENLEIEGLRDWRLPQVGELSSLATSNMIARGMYWSSTAGDTFGDDHMAWNVRRSHASLYGKDAVAVCVRGAAVAGS